MNSVMNVVNVVIVTRTAYRVLDGTKSTRPLVLVPRKPRLSGRTVLHCTEIPKRLTMVMTNAIVRKIGAVI